MGYLVVGKRWDMKSEKFSRGNSTPAPLIDCPTDRLPAHTPMRAPRAKSIIVTTVVAMFVLIAVAFCSYCFANRDRIFPAKNTVVVYGRETSGITMAGRSQLDAQRVPYIFADINSQAIRDELRYKLGPKFTATSYTLPVVHVAGRLLLTSSADEIVRELSIAGDQVSRDYSTFLNGSDPPPHD
jgi:hypothetical protein